MGVPAGPSTPPTSPSLVTVADVKAHLNMTGDDGSHDGELQGFIDAATPLVQNVTGPIVVTAYDEWYDGGHRWLMLRHRPVLSLTAVTEYIGPIAYALTIVASPDAGSIYSVMLDGGDRLVRRSAGGSERAFAAGSQTVRVEYTAGQASTPPNVRLGTLELVRENYQQTQQGGRRGSRPAAAADEPSPLPRDFFMSPRVLELLTPGKRRMAIA